MSRYSCGPGKIQLKDGPGAGKSFWVQRAPILIRAVSTPNNIWNVLDLLEDEPTPDEEIHVYWQMSWVHVRANRRRDSGVYYDYVHVPIDGFLKGQLRYERRWRAWAELKATELDAAAS